jgi:hypothetical protein
MEDLFYPGSSRGAEEKEEDQKQHCEIQPEMKINT